MNQQSQRYNMRQIRLMEMRISEYEEKKVSIGCLIKDLESLIGRLRETPKTTTAKFISWWSKLEVIYACALDDEKEFFDERDMSIITTALEKICELIELYKEEYLPLVKDLDDEELVVELD